MVSPSAPQTQFDDTAICVVLPYSALLQRMPNAEVEADAQPATARAAAVPLDEVVALTAKRTGTRRTESHETAVLLLTHCVAVAVVTSMSWDRSTITHRTDAKLTVLNNWRSSDIALQEDQDTVTCAQRPSISASEIVCSVASESRW
jgi:hypothetical protein